MAHTNGGGAGNKNYLYSVPLFTNSAFQIGLSPSLILHWSLEIGHDG